MVDSRSLLRRRQIRYGAPWLAILASYERLHQAHERLQWAFWALCRQVQGLRSQTQAAQQQIQIHQDQIAALHLRQQELEEALLRARAKGESLSDRYHQAISASYRAEVRARRAEQALAATEAELQSLARRYGALQQLESRLLADQIRGVRSKT